MSKSQQSKKQALILPNSNNFNDSLKSLVSGLGTEKDKRMSGTYQFETIHHNELSAIYYSNGLGAKIVNIPVDDMTRRWRKYSSPSLSPENLSLLSAQDEKLNTKGLFNEAQKWARLYGGAIIVMGIDGTGDHTEPLDIDRVTKDSLKYLHVFDRHEVSSCEINNSNPAAPNFRQPEYYILPNQSDKIHYTRVLRFDGVKMPWRLRKMNSYWNASIYNSIYNDLRNCDTIKDSTATLVLEAKKDIVQIEGLKQMILAGQEDKIIERFALADLMKSNFNMLLLDGDESYQQVTNGFAGLQGLVQQYLNVLASISQIPATKLLGESAPGLNSTGEEQTKMYYDYISALQKTEFTPSLTRLDEILVRNLFGKPVEDLKSTWNSLWELSDTEKSTIQKKNADRDSIYLSTNVVSVEEVRAELKEEETYDNLQETAAPAVTEEGS